MDISIGKIISFQLKERIIEGINCISQYSNLTYDLGYNMDYNKYECETLKFQNICGNECRTLLRKSQKKTTCLNITLYGDDILLYASEFWSLMKYKINRIEATELHFLSRTLRT
jgi:hypothetical protein